MEVGQRWERVCDLAGTIRVGEALGSCLGAGAVLLLAGELGAGKTTLTQAIARGLGVPEPVVSPTFVLMNEYEGGRLPLYHFDLYRLEGSDLRELDPALYWEGLEVPPGLVVIEWPERLGANGPLTHVQVTLTLAETGRRTLAIAPVGPVPGWQNLRDRLETLGDAALAG